MKRIKNFFFAIIVSPEVVLPIIIALSIDFLSPNLTTKIGNLLNTNDDAWKYLPGLIIAISIAAFKFTFDLRQPLSNTSNKTLYSWPEYQLLVDRIYISILFIGMSCLIGVGLFIFKNQYSHDITGIFFIIGMTTSTSTFLTMALALQKLREILDR
ncbi:MAG: hypothetical protein HQL36_01130 [Alphaproteobacteria bacterium]|nr:hypothetical protein [Alphaproteobacteria bacterium]